MSLLHVATGGEPGQGSEAASASTEGGKDGVARAGGEAEKYSVLKEHLWELPRFLDGKKGD